MAGVPQEDHDSRVSAKYNAANAKGVIMGNISGGTLTGYHSG